MCARDLRSGMKLKCNIKATNLMKQLQKSIGIDDAAEYIKFATFVLRFYAFFRFHIYKFLSSHRQFTFEYFTFNTF